MSRIQFTSYHKKTWQRTWTTTGDGSRLRNSIYTQKGSTSKSPEHSERIFRIIICYTKIESMFSASNFNWKRFFIHFPLSLFFFLSLSFFLYFPFSILPLRLFGLFISHTRHNITCITQIQTLTLTQTDRQTHALDYEGKTFCSLWIVLLLHVMI